MYRIHDSKLSNASFVSSAVFWGGGVQASRGGFSAEDHVGVEAGAIYWHFVDIVWIGLFSSYYILR